MKKHTGLIFLILVTGLFFPACDSATNSNSGDEEEPKEALVGPTIFFSVQRPDGGDLELFVDSSGIVVARREQVPNQIVLTRNEHAELISRFSEFSKIKELYPNGVHGSCSDGDTYFIKTGNPENFETMTIDGCYVFNPIVFGASESITKVKQMVSILNAFHSRATEYGIHTWRGIDFSWSFDKSTYKLGEPIGFEYSFYNPSPKHRTVYIPENELFWVDYEYGSPRSNNFFWHDESASEINSIEGYYKYIQLEPNETKKYTYYWDQIDKDGEPIDPGLYDIYSGFIAAYEYLWWGTDTNFGPIRIKIGTPNQ